MTHPIGLRYGQLKVGYWQCQCDSHSHQAIKQSLLFSQILKLKTALSELWSLLYCLYPWCMKLWKMSAKMQTALFLRLTGLSPDIIRRYSQDVSFKITQNVQWLKMWNDHAQHIVAQVIVHRQFPSRYEMQHIQQPQAHCSAHMPIS